MSKSSECWDGGCETLPSIDSRELLLERSAEEVRYGSLWAEVELPKLLALAELCNEDNKQP